MSFALACETGTTADTFACLVQGWSLEGVVCMCEHVAPRCSATVWCGSAYRWLRHRSRRCPVCTSLMCSRDMAASGFKRMLSEARSCTRTTCVRVQQCKR